MLPANDILPLVGLHEEGRRVEALQMRVCTVENVAAHCCHATHAINLEELCNHR